MRIQPRHRQSPQYWRRLAGVAVQHRRPELGAISIGLAVTLALSSAPSRPTPQVITLPAFSGPIAGTVFQKFIHRHIGKPAPQARPRHRQGTQPVSRSTLRPALYQVRWGDTLNQIAAVTRLPSQYLAHRNHIAYPRLLQAGSTLQLTGPVTWHGIIHWDSLPETSEPAPAPVAAPVHTAAPVPAPAAPTHTAAPAPTPAPVSGPIPCAGTWTRQFGYPYPTWDISLPGDADFGEPIRAAASGKVYGPWFWNYSYGYHVVIGNRLYGHMSAIYVHTGQYVSYGQLIGRVGSTGNSTGPHLHYEIRPYVGSTTGY